jgi:PAS domain S-box-containing protein
MADSFSKLKKSELIQLADNLQKQNGNYKKRIKKLIDFKKQYEQLNEKVNELESISKIGHWRIKLPEFAFELSDEIYNIFEIPKEGAELSFENFLEFIHPTDRVDVKSTLENALRQKTKIQNAYRIITPNRKIRLLYLNGKVYFKDGVPYEILGTTQDITQIKKVDTDKWESEEKFISILNNSASALTLSKLSDGELIEANEAFGKLVGYSRKYLIGKRTTDLGLWKNLNDRKKLVNAVKQNSIVENFELIIKTKGGNEKWVLMSAELITISGEKKYLLTTAFDISEKKKIEESLKRSEDRFKVVSELTSDFAYAFKFDDKGNAKTEWVSGAIEKITGYSRDQITEIGGWEKLIFKEDIKIVHDQLDQLLKGKPKTVEYRIINKNGKLLWVRDYAKSKLNKTTGKVESIFGAMQDITEQKLSEQKIYQLNRILRTISEINQLIVKETNKEKILSETCRILVEMGKFPMAWIGMADHSTSKLIPLAQSGFPKNYLNKLDIRFDNSMQGKGIAGTAVRTGKNIICKNIKIDKNFSVWWSEAEALGYKASAALPLKIDKNIIGVLNVHLLDGDGLTKDMIDLLDELAGDVSLALRLIGQSEAREKAEEALKESELRYRHFVDQTSDGFYRLAADKPIDLNDKSINKGEHNFGDFYILECNEVLAIMYGYKSVEQVRGLFLREIQKDWDEKESIQSFKEFLKNDLRMINSETLEYDQFGNQKYFRNNFVGIIKNNMLVEIWGTQQDITDQKRASEAIKESEKRFRSLFEHSAIGVAQIYTDTGKFYKVNKKYGAILGYSVDEMLKLTFQKITHPDDIEKDLANMKKLTEGIITEFSMNKRYFHKNGSIVWVNLTVSPLWEPNEQKEFHMAVVEDITDKKKAEIALHESAEQYKILFDGNPNPMFVFDREKLNFLDVNHAAVKHYGYSLEEFLNMSIKDIRPEEDVPKLIELVEKLDKKFSQIKRFRHKKKNGEIIYVDITSSSIKYKNRKAEVAVIYDITDRVIAEQALRESEEKFRSVFTDSHDCIYVTSAEGKLLNMNDAGLELFKLRKEEVPNQIVLDLYSNPEERNKFIEQINREGFVKDYSVKLKNRLNTELDCLLTASVKKDGNGNVLSYQGIIRDITEQKKSERDLVIAKEHAERADRLKTEFLAQMSHEIRTPINTLLSFSSLIREETKEYITADLKQYFHYQVSAGNRIIRTIDLILNMSEIQTGSFQLNLAELNLADLIDEIYNDYKSIAEQNGLVINLFSQEDKMKIKADEYSVHQIFSNLIDNSIKYTPEGSVTLTAKKENSLAIIEVIDTGIGMTEEYLQNIFKPFTQEEQGYTRKFEGSGLGLSLVKKYCEFNNAKISVESKKNVGSKFIVSFNLME